MHRLFPFFVQSAFFRCHSGYIVLRPSCLQSRSGPDASVCPDTLVHRTRMRLHIRFRARSLPDTIKDHRLIRFLVQQLHQSGHSFGWNEHSVEKNRKAGLETHGTNTGQNTLMDFHYQVLACPDFHKKRNKTAFSENRKTASKTIHTVPFPQKTPASQIVLTKSCCPSGNSPDICGLSFFVHHIK